VNVGDSVGSYRIVGTCGEGGMGSVFLAQHALIGHYVAIKVLHSHLCEKEEQVNRFFNEARATSQIKHPSILEVFDFGWHTDGSAYIVMEFLEGESLEDRIHRLGRISTEHALHITRQVAGALAAAHACGVVHRDLKPENIHIVRDPEVAGGERIKILDFGIAKFLGGNTSTTRAGALIGTPDYMAPEQCRGSSAVDHRADFYSLGCILFRMVCGRAPFVADGVGEVLAAHLHLEPPSPRSVDPHIEPMLELFILRLLAKEPDQRFQSAVELINELDSVWVGTFPGVMAVGTSGGVSNGRPQGKGTRPRSAGPSTISSAAGEVPPSARASSSPAGRLVAIAVVAVLAAGGAGFAMFKADRNSVAEEGAGETAVETDRRGATTSPAEGVIRPDIEQVTIVLRSEPSGAYVFRESDGLRVGTTPYRYSLDPAKGELVYRLKLEGYEMQTVVVSAHESSERTIELEQDDAGKRTPRNGGSKSDPFDDVDLGGDEAKGGIDHDYVLPPTVPSVQESAKVPEKKIEARPRKQHKTSPRKKRVTPKPAPKKPSDDNAAFDPFD